MNEDTFRVMELAMQGYQCSQILMVLALEAQGKQNPDLAKSMSGLVGGMGCGKACGALTGGSCVLGLFAGKESSEQNNDERLQLLLSQFGEWFDATYTARFGGINCDDIVHDDMRAKLSRCPTIVIESLEKLKELLAENNYEFNDPTRSA